MCTILTCSRSKIPKCMLHMPPKAQIFFGFALWWPVFKLRPNCRKKCTEWPQNELDMFKLSCTHMHARYNPESPIFASLPLVGKVLRMTPKWHWYMFKVKYTYAYMYYMYIHPQGPTYRAFRNTINLKSFSSLFREKCSEWPHMTLTCFKNIIMCDTYTLEAQIFVRFALRWTVFELYLFFRKSALDDPNTTLTRSRSKVHICIIHASTSPRPNFLSVSLYYGPFSIKLGVLNSDLVAMPM